MQDEKCQSPKLPDDTIGRERESRKLWRRAVCRCRRILFNDKRPYSGRTNRTAYRMVSSACSNKVSWVSGIVGEGPTSY